MKGYPKYLNSKADYLYVKNHSPKEKWQSDFQALLDDHVKWIMTNKLDALKDGMVDKTHEIRTVKDVDDSRIEEYYQYELKEDPNCKLVRLGFTVKEIEQILKSPVPK